MFSVQYNQLLRFFFPLNYPCCCLVKPLAEAGEETTVVGTSEKHVVIAYLCFILGGKTKLDSSHNFSEVYNTRI